jgi:hypothetical protein
MKKILLGVIVLVLLYSLGYYFVMFAPMDKAKVDSQQIQVQNSRSKTYIEKGDLSDAEFKNVQDGYEAGFLDGETTDFELKHSYIEPNAEDNYKNVYFYSYLEGYIRGCSNIDSTRDDCKYAGKTLDELKDLPSAESSVQEVISNKPACENESEIETFKKPIPVVWLARMGGCLAGCEGTSFDRMPEKDNFKYPSFSGYSNDGIISEEFLKKGLTLKIYGKWTGIADDYVDSVFNGKCSPVVDIDKIEIVN